MTMAKATPKKKVAPKRKSIQELQAEADAKTAELNAAKATEAKRVKDLEDRKKTEQGKKIQAAQTKVNEAQKELDALVASVKGSPNGNHNSSLPSLPQVAEKVTVVAKSKPVQDFLDGLLFRSKK